MRAKVAILKADHTWEERLVETDGANGTQAQQNAEMSLLFKLCPDYKLPPGIVGLKCIGLEDGSGDMDDVPLAEVEIPVKELPSPERVRHLLSAQLIVVAQVVATVRQIIKIFNSEASWKTKYDVIFGIRNGMLEPQLKAAGLELEWYNPDTDYQDDVTAFVNAAEKLLEELEKL